MSFFDRCKSAGRVLMHRELEKGLLSCPHLDKDAVEQLKNEIADKIVERLENKIYLRVGKGVVHKVLWLIGLGAVSIHTWLNSKGWLQ